MNQVLLGLGSNIGDRLANIAKAEELIALEVGKIIMSSPVYESEPWGFKAEKNFFNKVILVETPNKPDVLLKKLLKIENDLGRKRADVYISRTIDIDILFYNDLIINNDDLKIPHPLINERRFVLEPLNEIMPGFIHPVNKRCIKELLEICPDKFAIVKIEHF